jgi:hypothetical protein
MQAYAKAVSTLPNVKTDGLAKTVLDYDAIDEAKSDPGVKQAYYCKVIQKLRNRARKVNSSDGELDHAYARFGKACQYWALSMNGAVYEKDPAKKRLRDLKFLSLEEMADFRQDPLLPEVSFAAMAEAHSAIVALQTRRVDAEPALVTGTASAPSRPVKVIPNASSASCATPNSATTPLGDPAAASLPAAVKRIVHGVHR